MPRAAARLAPPRHPMAGPADARLDPRRSATAAAATRLAASRRGMRSPSPPRAIGPGGGNPLTAHALAPSLRSGVDLKPLPPTSTASGATARRERNGRRSLDDPSAPQSLRSGIYAPFGPLPGWGRSLRPSKQGLRSRPQPPRSRSAPPSLRGHAGLRSGPLGRKASLPTLRSGEPLRSLRRPLRRASATCCGRSAPPGGSADFPSRPGCAKPPPSRPGNRRAVATCEHHTAPKTAPKRPRESRWNRRQSAARTHGQRQDSPENTCQKAPYPLHLVHAKQAATTNRSLNRGPGRLCNGPLMQRTPAGRTARNRRGATMRHR
jgi:hypothetical protein